MRSSILSLVILFWLGAIAVDGEKEDSHQDIVEVVPQVHKQKAGADEIAPDPNGTSISVKFL